MANHPHQLPRDHYVGKRAHFLTLCTHSRREIFREADACHLVIDQLLRACRKHSFEVLAYGVMPDHVHVLVLGTHDNSNFLKWLYLFKQLSAYYEKRRSGYVLWQEGHWDYTLRDSDAVGAIASYIVWNPVEAGLASRPEHYPYVGSERLTVSELAAVRPCKPPIGDF